MTHYSCATSDEFKPLNVLIITGIFPPDIGGPASFVPALAGSLVKKGHTIRVITLSDSAGCNEHNHDLKVYRIRRSIPRFLRFLITVAWIAGLGKSADVLFVNGLALESVVANYLLRKPLVQKIVGDLVWERLRTRGTTGDSLDEFQKKTYSVRIELLKRLRTFWVMRSDLVIVPSRYLKGIVECWGVPEHRIRVIYNAVEIRQPTASRFPFAPADGGAFPATIVSVGRLVSWKGFDILIRAVKNFPDARCIIAGDGPERENLERLIRECGLQERVVLAGRCSREEVFSLLLHGDLFVLNSSYEGLPHIVLEALAAGIPAIVTNAGGTGEIIQDGYNGIVLSSRTQSMLEQAVARLLRDDALRSTLVKNGLAAAERYSWENLVTETEQALCETPAARNVRRGKGGKARCGELPRVLFLSTARIGDPPDSTLEKKWKGLGSCLKPTVIAFRDGYGPVRQVFQGGRWIVLPASIPRILRYALHFSVSFLYSVRAAAGGRYGVIVAQSPYEALAPALALLPWHVLSLSCPKLIIEIHNDWKEGIMYYHPSRFSRLEGSLRAILGRFSLCRADAYRVISEYCRSLVPAGEKPVFVFPTFTDLSSFTSPASERIADVRERYGTGYFLFAGMLIRLKGVQHLLRAFADVCRRYPDARLVLAGTGAHEQQFRLQAEELHLREKVCFVGHVDQKTLAAFFANSRALVLPSLTEGLGRVAIEAYVLERPVIASRVGGLPEIVVPQETGFLVEPGDENALAGAMAELIEHPDMAEIMGRAGKARVLEAFQYEQYFQSYCEMIKKTLGE